MISPYSDIGMKRNTEIYPPRVDRLQLSCQTRSTCYLFSTMKTEKPEPRLPDAQLPKGAQAPVSLKPTYEPATEIKHMADFFDHLASQNPLFYNFFFLFLFLKR